MGERKNRKDAEKEGMKEERGRKGSGWNFQCGSLLQLPFFSFLHSPKIKKMQLRQHDSLLQPLHFRVVRAQADIQTQKT